MVRAGCCSSDREVRVSLKRGEAERERGTLHAESSRNSGCKNAKEEEAGEAQRLGEIPPEDVLFVQEEAPPRAGWLLGRLCKLPAKRLAKRQTAAKRCQGEAPRSPAAFAAATLLVICLVLLQPGKPLPAHRPTKARFLHGNKTGVGGEGEYMRMQVKRFSSSACKMGLRLKGRGKYIY